ncbi:MAG: putative regulator of Ras-like GTPase activity (Roadblock/LC7/MglB family) [Planctomycetota bacterium]|jgi:predicted regulator of Ras-like GTPase activity (Roadblock/LC7/MglB family)
MTSDQKLREEHMCFYTKDVALLDEELDGFLELSGARCALLVDRSGHMVTRRGTSLEGSLESVAALAAGSFAATREMASLLGEGEFNNLFHQGSRESIQISAIGERSLFVIVFDDHSNMGLVRFYAEETTGRLTTVLAGIAERNAAAPSANEGLSGDFSSAASAALDDLF